MAELESSIYKGSADDFEHSCGQCILDGHAHVEAHGFCTDCPGYLCVTCFRAHRINKASRHHKLLGNDELSNARIAHVSPSICTEKCSVHINEIVKFFCSKHESLCCNDCVILNHRNCEVDYIPEKCLAIEDSTEFQETLHELGTCLKTSDNVKIAAEKTEVEIDSSTESAINEIRTFEEELHDHIVKLREKVENEVETRRTTNKQRVKDVVDTCDELSSSLNQFRKGILDNKKERNLAQLYINMKKTKNALKSLKINESMKMLCDTRTQFHFERGRDIENLLEKTVCFGDLKETGHICRDAIINRRKITKTHIYYVVLYVGSSHMEFRVSTITEPKSIWSKTWYNEGYIYNKVPASLLIEPDGKSVCAFGYEADRKYKELTENEEEENYFYFHGDYVLCMYRDMEEKKTFATDMSGKKLPSIVIMSTLIRVLNDEVVKHIKRRNCPFREGDVHFIITVPERFETAKDAMEEAAIQAGIDPKKFTIAFETEAAFMYIQDDTNYSSYNGEQSIVELKGNRFLVLDARAKLFTSTVYDVFGDKSTMLYHEADESCGGDSVREELEIFLSSIFGDDILQEFKSSNPEGYREMIFEIYKKVKIQPHLIRIKYGDASAFYDFVQEHTRGTVNDLVSKQTTAEKATVSSKSIIIYSSIFTKFFQRSVSTIASRIRCILQRKEGVGCTAIVMIGGYSNSKILQECLKKEFSELQVLVPCSPDEAVFEGAVALGYSLRT